jgi:glutamine synthetase
VEHELYKLGVPIVMRHNEVAPCQFEMAPIYEESDVAEDHNQLVMAALRKVALRHGLQVLLHEKPFAGINGSGKHCNWSMAIAADNELNGVNLFKPGKTPQQNIRFLLLLAAVLKAVHRHAGLLRAGIAYSGNDHRLGANEAPPAIISVFLGDMLTGVIDDIANGRTTRNADQAMLRLGVAKLPEIQRDVTDRNRTSPLAFTGAKFEFRAVGASQSTALPITLLHAAVAEALGELTAKLREELEKTSAIPTAALAVVREAFRETAAVRFEGNNYSEEWVEEAERRGLPHLRNTPEALKQLISESSRALFSTLGILSTEELESRFHVRMERYVKDLLIEINTLNEMADTIVLSAALEYHGVLAAGAAQARSAGITSIPQVDAANELGDAIAQLRERRAKLGKVAECVESLHHDVEAQARLLAGEGASAMAGLRESCDALELMVGDDYWPLPKYREILFPV